MKNKITKTREKIVKRMGQKSTYFKKKINYILHSFKTYYVNTKNRTKIQTCLLAKNINIIKRFNKK